MSTPVSVKTTPARDEKGRFVETDPPLVDLTVNNPVTTLKKWWKKVIANEGVDFHLRIHPLTAIGIASVIALGSYGLGRISVPAESPIATYLPQLVAQPTPDPWRETAFTGIVRRSTRSNTFYLQTERAEAITLEVPKGIQLTQLVGKRIFATGKYNPETDILVISEATDLEILPNEATYLPGVSPKPTILPSPSPSPTSSPTPDVSPTSPSPSIDIP